MTASLKLQFLQFNYVTLSIHNIEICYMTNLASTFPPTQRIEVLRLDNVCYIKHPRPALQVKARDSMPPLFTSPLCTLWEESIGRVWRKRVSSIPFPCSWEFASSCISCNSKGRKGGNSIKAKRWKDWYPLIFIGGLVETQLFCQIMKRWAETLEGPQEC